LETFFPEYILIGLSDMDFAAGRATEFCACFLVGYFERTVCRRTRETHWGRPFDLDAPPSGPAAAGKKRNRTVKTVLR
jgi:hypothetical protein